MLHKQISVFIENKRGRLAEITKVLGDNGVDMRALCIADTKDFGILRIISDKPELAERALRDRGYAVSITDVIAVLVDDRPGGLAAALGVLDECEINIEYMYHFIRNRSDTVAIIIRVENPVEALERIKKTPLSLLPADGLDGAV
ncbi:MAG: ACT domain-containing protein [Oscillospiraceae bacterium]|nr:ACT domain-containing protein [Oscillospiraceae bacterium]